MNTNTILIIVISLIVAAGAYWFFFTGEGNEPSLSVNTTENPTQARFQTLVRELQSISLDASIFTEPRFMVLMDLTTPVTPETVGRLDPFAPVSAVNKNE